MNAANAMSLAKAGTLANRGLRRVESSEAQMVS